LAFRASFVRTKDDPWAPREGWAVVSSTGSLHLHPTRRGTPQEWLWVCGHGLLHLGFGHFQRRARPELWNLACDVFVNRFLADLKLGQPPADLDVTPTLPSSIPLCSENALYDWLFDNGVPKHLGGCGTAGSQHEDMVWGETSWRGPIDWREYLGSGLRSAVSAAVDLVAGKISTLAGARGATTPAQRAWSWFMTHYPLLGSLAAAFRLVEDEAVCRRLDVQVAAVDAEAREVYFNPRIGWSENEARFVIAHELLHAGLRHQARTQGRDPFLWNVACDFVINAWLVDMGIGDLPAFGLLHDPALKGLSAEAVYDRIVTDLRKYRKLATFRGAGVGDILPGQRPRWWESAEGVTLDAFYRNCLGQGLLAHHERGRGLLPAGLVEEIEALSQPPVPWDVELAQWFDHRFPPLERRRSFARPSRRQMATPELPRPRAVPVGDGAVRTFAVLLDTSGSMNRKLLAKALGAIASYAAAREVDLVRLVFCDAAVYDQGFVRPEDIAGRVKVRGRGGTVLQPGLDLLDQARDFPPAGPALIITDGFCDNLRVRRDHAFLMPDGHRLPFAPRGPVFRVS
jgi:predicted metal-dependent peptidase